MKPQLIVTKEGSTFECMRRGDCGMFIVGKGKSVTEAVGDWCIFSGKVEVLCQPPELLEQFSVQEAAGLSPAPRR